MKSLIVDDELTTRLLLKKILSPFGDCTTVPNGKDAIQAFWMALKENSPYNLIMLDIIMPDVNGQVVLQKIREIENKSSIPKEKQATIIMTTAIDDSKVILDSVVKYGCNSYILKPVIKMKVLSRLKELELI